MSKKDEALKLALEALQKIYIAPEHEEYIRVWWPACEQAITALREALAEQPAQQALDKMAENARELGLDYEPVWNNLPPNKDVEDAMHLKRLSQLAEQPAQQEPVATVVSESGNPNVSMSWWHEPALPVGTKLYTSPPAQRTWVGLTEEDENKLLETVIGSLPIAKNLIRAIEAKLREKNT